MVRVSMVRGNAFRSRFEQLLLLVYSVRLLLFYHLFGAHNLQHFTIFWSKWTSVCERKGSKQEMREKREWKTKPPKKLVKSKEFRQRQIFKTKIWVETLNLNTQFDTNEVTKTISSTLNIYLREFFPKKKERKTNVKQKIELQPQVTRPKQWNPNHAISHVDIHFNFFFIAHTKTDRYAIYPYHCRISIIIVTSLGKREKAFKISKKKINIKSSWATKDVERKSMQPIQHRERERERARVYIIWHFSQQQ